MIFIQTVIDKLTSPSVYKRYFAYSNVKKGPVTNVLKQICDRYQKSYGVTELESEKLRCIIEETVKSYTSDKNSAIMIVKKLIDFLEEDYCFYVDMDLCQYFGQKFRFFINLTHILV